MKAVEIYFNELRRIPSSVGELMQWRRDFQRKGAV